MKKILERKVYWITGTFVSLTGVAAVRLIAPAMSGVMNTVVMISGYVLALVGIGIIACSTRGHNAREATNYIINTSENK